MFNCQCGNANSTKRELNFTFDTYQYCCCTKSPAGLLIVRLLWSPAKTSVAALGSPYISALPSASSQEALYTKPRLLLMKICETLSLSSKVLSLLIKSTRITHLLVFLPVYTLATLAAVLYPQTSRTLFEFALHTCSPCSVLAAWVATHF
jgi:hypothetical protein